MRQAVPVSVSAPWSQLPITPPADAEVKRSPLTAVPAIVPIMMSVSVQRPLFILEETVHRAARRQNAAPSSANASKK